jgi:putative oxidoreductase
LRPLFQIGAHDADQIIRDPMMAQIQMILFVKNVSKLGGALLISHFGAGPFSLDARRPR